MTSAFRDVFESPDCSAELRERVRTGYRWDEVANSYMRLAEGCPAAYRATMGEQILGAPG
jgi:hypothetical protein